jgi:hypothetical protein
VAKYSNKAAHWLPNQTTNSHKTITNKIFSPMKKSFDFGPILWVIIIAFAAFVSSCASSTETRPYNSVVLGIHTTDTILNANTFDRVEYYTGYTVTPVDSIQPITSRVFVYDNGIELFILFQDGETIHDIVYGDWLDEYIFKSHDGTQILNFNEEYLDYITDGLHFELIK